MRSSDIRHVHAMVMLVAGVLACAAGPAAAEHLGIIGPVHAIGEPDLMVEIDRTLRQATADGRFARFETEARSRILRGIEDPAPIAGITRATSRRTRYHDPSMVVPAAITDAAGRVVVAAGTVVNPLDTVTLSKPLLFFDGRDDGQVKRARELLDRHRGAMRPVLTAGSWLALMRRWKRPVYFDQHGQITARLGITRVPALVTQDGRRLRIDELP
jgi:conjugal transfer pilus assembly protein TraW